jgi:hypothetical protein
MWSCHFTTVLLKIGIMAMSKPITLASLILSRLDYAPVSVAYPSKTLVRPAAGLNKDEEEYRMRRKEVADGALRPWLMKIDADFGEPSA